MQTATDANIVLLKREGDTVKIINDPISVTNWRVDQILTSDLFGLPSARPPHIEKFRQKRRSLLSKPDLSDEEWAEVKVLEEKMGTLPYGESEMEIKARQLVMDLAERVKGYRVDDDQDK